MVFGVVESFQQEGYLTIVGDLFITEEGIHYVPLRKIVSSLVIFEVIDGLITGQPQFLGSMLSETQIEENVAKIASVKAKIARKQLEGLSLKEKLSSIGWKDWVVEVSRDNLESLCLKNNMLICKTKHRKIFYFKLPENKEWPQSIRTIIENYPHNIQRLSVLKDLPTE